MARSTYQIHLGPKMIEAALAEFGTTQLAKKDVRSLIARVGMDPSEPMYMFRKEQIVGRNLYDVRPFETHDVNTVVVADLAEAATAVSETAPRASVVMRDVSYIPATNRGFIRTSYFKKIHAIIKSRMFFPVYISGLSGLGKTETVQQAAASLKREVVRVNFTEETAERHLIGGWRLDSGNTIWEDGPVLVAMRRGAILLLDEIDFSSSKVLCLQSILEGSSYINKQTGDVVTATPGFTIIATANTKGQVSGRNAKFVGARAQNDAFLDRFEICIEQEYPDFATESAIMTAFYKILNRVDEVPEKEAEILKTMVAWAQMIREAYAKGVCNDVISTRRLKSALKSYSIFHNVKTAIIDILARFPEETQKAFIGFYNALSKEDINVAVTENLEFDDEHDEMVA